MEEFGDLFSRSGLFEHLDEGLTSMPEYESLYSKDYKFIPAPEGMPDHGVLAFEFSSYGEALIFKICNMHTVAAPPLSLRNTATSGKHFELSNVLNILHALTYTHFGSHR